MGKCASLLESESENAESVCICVCLYARESAMFLTVKQLSFQDVLEEGEVCLQVCMHECVCACLCVRLGEYYSNIGFMNLNISMSAVSE